MDNFLLLILIQTDANSFYTEYSKYARQRPDQWVN